MTLLRSFGRNVSRAGGALVTYALISACGSPAAPSPTPASLVERVIWTTADFSRGPTYFNDRAAPKLAPGQVYARASCDVEAVITLGIGLVGRPGGLPVPTPLALEASFPCTPDSAQTVVPMFGRAVGGEDVLIIQYALPGVDPDTVADGAVNYDVDIIQLGW